MQLNYAQIRQVSFCLWRQPLLDERFAESLFGELPWENHVVKLVCDTCNAVIERWSERAYAEIADLLVKNHAGHRTDLFFRPLWSGKSRAPWFHWSDVLLDKKFRIHYDVDMLNSR